MGNITQRVVAINDFGLQERTRVSTVTGKDLGVRFAVSIVGTPVIHNIDTKALGKGPALAIEQHLRASMLSIQAKASDSTLERRKNAVAAHRVDDSKKFQDSLEARYSGGRLGTMPPNQSDRLFNDSGRFAKSIKAGFGNGNEWVINVAKNRLDPTTLNGGEVALAKVYAKLVELIPEFGDPEKLMKVNSVALSIVDAWRNVVMKNEDLRLRASRAQLDFVRNALGLVF